MSLKFFKPFHSKKSRFVGRMMLPLWLAVLLLSRTISPILAATTDSGDVNVSATVPPTINDFAIGITSATTNPIHQNESASYQITYSTNNYHAASYVITASWQQGTIAGQPSPSVDTLVYVNGSASSGYNGAVPIIDTINRTITWHITNVPANTTGQTLTFALSAIANYTGNLSVTIPVSVSAEIDNIVLPDQSVDTLYSYTGTTAETSPTPTPTPSPAASPTSSTSPSPTPIAQKPAAPIFDDVSIASKSDTQLSVIVRTDQETKLLVKAGTSFAALQDVQSQATFSKRHSVVLDELIPETTYYLQFKATSEDGQTTTSDVYAYTTAKKNQELPSVDPNSVVLTSGQTLMVGSALNKNNIDNFKIVLPVNKNFEFSFILAQGKKLQKIEVWIENNVLGISTLTQKATQPNSLKVEVVELLPGRFQGRLLTPVSPGEYKLTARIFDTDGNVNQQSLGTIQVVPQLKVVDSLSGKPVESAQITLWYWRESVSLFEPLPVEFFGLSNPVYTNSQGELALALPLGKYRVKVVALGYQEQEKEFVVGGSGGNYPSVSLVKQPVSLITSVHYYSTILWDISNDTQTYIKNLAESARYFELNAIIVFLYLGILLMFVAADLVHVPVHQLFSYALHKGTIFALRKKLGNKIHGRIFDRITKTPLAGATIFLIDRKKRQVVATTVTCEHGDFSFEETNQISYDLQVVMIGYEPVLFRQSNIEEVGLGGYLLSIQPRQKGVTLVERLVNELNTAVEMLFSTLLMFSFLAHIMIFQVLGLDKDWLFLLLSVVNIVLWIWHISHRHADQNVY